MEVSIEQTFERWEEPTDPDSMKTRLEVRPPSKLVFDINNKLRGDTESLNAQYTFTLTFRDPKSTAPARSDTVGRGHQLQWADISVSRRLEFCDAELNVADEGGPEEAPPGSFFLSASVTFPVKVTTTCCNPPLISRTDAEGGIAEAFHFNYDFTQREHEERQKELPTEELREQWNREVRRTVSYRLSTKPLALKYMPMKKDMRSVSGRYTGYKHLSGNFAKDDVSKSSFVHGNSQIQVLVEGRDVTRSFILWRYARFSRAGLSPNKQPTGPYTSARPPWVDDNPQRRPDEWVDTPGSISSQPPNRWPRERGLYEFVAGVHRFPEFGLLYFVVVIETVPNEYRVRMYDAEAITIERWCEIKKSDRPYQDERTRSPAIDSGWQRAR